MKAYFVLNKHVKINGKAMTEGVFWRKKNARAYARQLVRKTGSLNYKFLYYVVSYTLPQTPPGDMDSASYPFQFEIILHTLIEQFMIE